MNILLQNKAETLFGKTSMERTRQYFAQTIILKK